jgi:glucosamine--fructose-6-phosphate aminotransferase (isomerizing)
MCGIVGCVGNKKSLYTVLEGLKALEYRGYDSAGISVIENGTIFTVKCVGRVNNLIEKVDEEKHLYNSTTAIGHTRWATHGSPSIKNAHPHNNNQDTISVVHNGIIENYRELKTRLQKLGYVFTSETDTEVIPHLIDFHLKKEKKFIKAFPAAINELQGAYAIGAIYSKEPDTLYAAKLSSPLLIGIGDDCHCISSGASAISEIAKKVVYLNDLEFAVINKDGYKIHHLETRAEILRKSEKILTDSGDSSMNNFPNYMLKEIYDSPETIKSATAGRLNPKTNVVKLGGLETVAEQLKYIDRIVIIGCGTSYYAGLVGEYLIEEIANIPVEVQLASEFRYKSEPFSRSTALLAISQSGETADTISALKKVDGYGVLKLGIVNNVGSTIARMTDAGVYCHAGPEKSVASTKAFIAQVTVLTEIALYLSQGKSPLHKSLVKGLADLPEQINSILENTDSIKSIAEKFSSSKDFLFIGRGYNYPCALEGALKLKELSYIHAEGYAAGEMKHGPLAMIDGSMPTLAIATDNSLLEKTKSNIEEIKSRNGPIIAIATVGDKSIKKLTRDVIYIPKVIEQIQPILVAIVLQLFAYYIATDLGRDIDKPRNLAKSVTVE